MRKLVRVFLGGLVVFMPIPLGSNRPWIVLACLAAVLLVGGIAALVGVPKARFPRRARQLGVLIGLGAAWLLYLALQLAGGFQLMASLEGPGQFDARQAIRALQDVPQVLPVTLFPDATLNEIAYGLLGFTAFALTAWAVRIPRHALGLFGFLMASVALQCAVGAWEYFMRLDFPAMTPLSDRPINGTFVNRNHFSGFIAAGAGVAIGLLAHALFAREAPRDSTLGGLALRLLDLVSGRYVAVVGVLVLMVTVIGASGSRGAMLGLVIAIVAGTGAMTLYAALGGRAALILGVVAIGLLSLLMANSTMLDRTARFFERGLEDGRLAEWSLSVEAIASRPVTGFGGGAFTDAYGLHRDGRLQRNQTFDHAHNQYLELLVENGMVGMALLAAFVLMTLRLAAISPGLSTDPGAGAAATGALFGMLALLGHALVEFTFEIPAILVAYFVLAGIATAVFTWMGPAQVLMRDAPDRIEADRHSARGRRGRSRA